MTYQIKVDKMNAIEFINAFITVGGAFVFALLYVITGVRK